MRPSDPFLFAMMSHSGMNLKSSWRMPSAWGRGVKLVWPVVSQIPVRRTKPSGGVNPGSIRYSDTKLSNRSLGLSVERRQASGTLGTPGDLLPAIQNLGSTFCP